MYNYLAQHPGVRVRIPTSEDLTLRKQGKLSLDKSLDAVRTMHDAFGTQPVWIEKIMMGTTGGLCEEHRSQRKRQAF